MASGPIQYDEYLEYSRHFRKRYCVDLSRAALDNAKCKIGDHGVFLHGNFLEMDVETDFFDCCISLHTIYHIHADQQENAVRKLLSCAKRGAPVIVIYANPDSFHLTRTTLFRAARTLAYPLKLLRRRLRPRPDSSRHGEIELNPYYHAHPLSWWVRFEDQASIEFHPWRTFSSDTQKTYFPDNRIGTWLFAALFWLEDHAPKFFLRNGCYPMIVMRKRPSSP
jgi:SAM-dependent methyltransferase